MTTSRRRKKPRSSPERSARKQPRAKKTESDRSFDSIAAAAAQLQVDPARLKAAKRQGAPGFRGSRVYPAELLPWLQAQPVQVNDKNALECQRLRIGIEQADFNFQKDKDLWIPKTHVDNFLSDLAERIKGVLRNKLRNDLPPKLEGLRAPEIAAKMDEVIKALIELLRAPKAPLTGRPD